MRFTHVWRNAKSLAMKRRADLLLSLLAVAFIFVFAHAAKSFLLEEVLRLSNWHMLWVDISAATGWQDSQQ